jgi:hypothetical protein
MESIKRAEGRLADERYSCITTAIASDEGTCNEASPVASPTEAPTEEPTGTATTEPATEIPTEAPTEAPTETPTTEPTPTVTPVGPTATIPSASPAIAYTTNRFRTGPIALDTATVTGKIFVFVPELAGITRVAWYQDGVTGRIELAAPWDLKGGTANAADPLDTLLLEDGEHEITAEVTYNGTVVNISAAFIVSNEGPEPTPTTEPTATGTPSTPTPTPVPGTPTPTPTATPIVTGQLELSATYNSIGVGLVHANAGQAQMRYRESGSGTWLDAMFMRHTTDAYYGSIMFLQPATTYDVEVTAGSTVKTGTITTRADQIVDNDSLAPSHTVCASGCDWATLEAAWVSAPAGAVVEVAPGNYAPPGSTRQLPITLTAANPAIDDDGNAINAGSRSVLLAPQVTIADATAEWTLVTLTGPKTGENYQLWHWESGENSSTPYLTIDGWRVAPWDREGSDVDGWTLRTPAGFAEVLYNSDRFRHGYRHFTSVDGASLAGDIYARFPDDMNPNEHTVRLGNSWMKVDGPDIRISGFELVQVTVNVGDDAERNVIDHNLFDEGVVWFSADKPSSYPVDTTVEYNVMEGSSIWSTDPNRSMERGYTIPWSAIKSRMAISGQPVYGWTRVLAGVEVHAIHGRGGSNRTVIRHNRISGYFNGFGGYTQDYDRNAWRDMDIHDNEIFDIGDDIIEPEGVVSNWRVWNNSMHDMFSAISTGPLRNGPLYIVNNLILDVGNHGSPPDYAGNQHNAKGFKYSGAANGTLVAVVGNTITTHPQGGETNGWLQAAGGGPSQEFFYVRNNFVAMTRYAADFPWDSWDEDYNHWYTSDLTRCLGDEKTIAEYRAKWTWGDHSNLFAECHDPVAADDPRLIDAGVVVPNLSDGYQGVAPDIGRGLD